MISSFLGTGRCADPPTDPLINEGPLDSEWLKHVGVGYAFGPLTALFAAPKLSSLGPLY